MTTEKIIPSGASAIASRLADRFPRPIRLVVVDDHPFLREGVVARLQQEPDFEVIGACANSPDARACVDRTAPDLVLMDLHLPGESGLVATRLIRQTHPSIKILILTGDIGPSVARAARDAGAHGLIRKADTSDTLLKAVRVVMTGGICFPPDASSAGPSGSAAGAGDFGPPPLNARELAVLQGIAEGLSYKEIAARLHLSAKSVEYYRTSLVKTTACATRADLVRLAIRLGLVSA